MSVEHWDAVYRGKGENEVSWFEESAQASLDLIDIRIPPPAGPAPGAAVDIGAGRSHLAQELLARGWHPVIALDISSIALAQLAARAQAAGLADGLICIAGDVLAWQPTQQVRLWHDRAVFHFLTEPADQDAYAELAARTVEPGGILVLATFAPDGPEQCSGLPTARHDAGSLAGIFAPAFRLVHQRRTEHRTPWGTIQPFTWVLLQRQPPDQ